MTNLCERRALAAETAGACDADAALLLTRVRAELVGLSARVLDMQRVLGPALAEACADHEVLHGCQDLDLVAQSLEGLSDFLAVVEARRGGGFDLAAAAAVVKLGGLAARLAGQAGGEAATPAGEPELF